MFYIIAGIDRKRLYTAVVSLVGIEGVVQVLKLNFSELCLHLFMRYVFLRLYVKLNCSESV